MGIKKRGKGKEPQEAKRKIEITGKAGELGKELKIGVCVPYYESALLVTI